MVAQGCQFCIRRQKEANKITGETGSPAFDMLQPYKPSHYGAGAAAL
jgi:hypothetical protein